MVRGVRNLVIAVSRPKETDDAGADKTALRQWGTRVWTLPEPLMIPSNRDILVYARNADVDAPMILPPQPPYSPKFSDPKIHRKAHTSKRNSSKFPRQVHRSPHRASQVKLKSRM